MQATILDLDTVSKQLQGETSLCPDTLYLHVQDCRLSVRSNSIVLISRLRRYFKHICCDKCPVDIEILAIDSAEPQLDINFLDWKREPGKTGRKDSYHDIIGGRLIRKIRTGMVFLQSEKHRIAAGPCTANDNQVINFINAQYMGWLQHRDWLICHASGLVHHGKALAIAGFSGGGKSTLMLHLLAREHMSYLSNDRLLIKRSATGIQAAGIPKLPRVNPGTIVHNPRLHRLIPSQERESLLALPTQELWNLEEKFDVDIDEIFGKDRILHNAPLQAFLILNWSLDTTAPFQVQSVELSKRHELLPAIMKSPGPFYQRPDGTFLSDNTELEEPPYLDALTGVQIYEATGRIDFAALAGFCLDSIFDESK